MNINDTLRSIYSTKDILRWEVETLRTFDRYLLSNKNDVRKEGTCCKIAILINDAS